MSDTPYEHLIVETKNNVATITINRPEVLNSFNGQTCEELIMAFTRAGWDQEVGVIVLTGAGDRAFCAAVTSQTRPVPMLAPAAPSGCRLKKFNH